MNTTRHHAERWTVELPRIGPVCRLGLATRGNPTLEAGDVERAVDGGVNYLNWCGHPDGLQQWVRDCGTRRHEVRVAVQLSARSAAAAERELEELLEQLGTDYLDVVTYYYVEHIEEWRRIVGSGGAADVIEAARDEGTVRAIGLTSHQRLLAAETADSGRLDLLMIRYNAAHRGAEADVFPVTRPRSLPVVAFTCLRWGELMKSPPDDPPGFEPPAAPACYRFVLTQPDISVALMAPDGADELDRDLAILDGPPELDDRQHAELAAHGDRVYRQAGGFP